MRRRAGMIIDIAHITTMAAIAAITAPVIMAAGTEPKLRPKMASES